MLRILGLIFMITVWFSPAAQAMCLGDGGSATEACRPYDIFVYLEQKTLVAGDGSVLVVAELVTDAGYSPPDRSLVHFFTRSGETISRRIAFTEAGIARARMPVGESAGAIEVWAEAGGVKAAVQWFEVVPEKPVPFALTISGCGPDRLCRIEARDLQDQYGNRLPDGLQGMLTTYVHGNLISQQAVYTVRGSIFAPWRRPDAEAWVRLTLAGEQADVWVVP